MERVKQAPPGDVMPDSPSPARLLDGHCTVFSHENSEVPNSRVIGDRQAYSCTWESPPPPPAPSEITLYAASWPPYVLLLVSCLAVAASGLGGNAARVMLQNSFVKNRFFAKYNYIVPNTLGSFLMGLFVRIIPPENTLPLSYRSFCVGFCGSFTTFSSWIVTLMVQSTAADAFEHLFIGGALPIMFFLWGRDCGRGVRWCCEHVFGCPWETWPSHPSRLRSIDAVWFLFLVIAAILAPVIVQVQINKGRIRVISTDDVRTVVIAPAGAVTRFLLSVYLNKKTSLAEFPLGTLAANLLGVLLAIIMLNMELTHIFDEWYVVVQHGICGALSTVSSLVNELVSFHGCGRVVFAYVYALVSVVVAIIIAGIGRPQNYHRSVN
ncbi:hypothetical protein JKF63_03972 [Porcisia hertigi]|uniref:CrcB-like protein n=1 Tax=Porcisia hertigi TaxID=2761500 RepID=A0A836L3T9_9TRYP|nr:hypothetical protein JKF63_03972 [Porcisia hertigi]